MGRMGGTRPGERMTKRNPSSRSTVNAAPNAIPPAVHRGTLHLAAAPAPAPVPARVTLTAIATTVETAPDSRTISGSIAVYDTPSTSQGIVMHAGALTARSPLSRVKLLRDHNQSDPVGYATSVDLEASPPTATFYVPEGENGDAALADAQAHLRDGFSMGFAVKEHAFDDAYNLHVYAAELYEVSLVAVPDYADAQVFDVAAAAKPTDPRGTMMNRAQLAAALAAGTITQETHDRELALIDQRDAQLAAGAQPTPEPAAQPVPRIDPALAAGPEPVHQGTAFTRPRNAGMDFGTMCRTLSTAFNTGDARTIQLAIQDITPSGSDPAQGFIGREDWVGEVWSASDFTRTWINAIGTPKQLTALKMKGWKWDVRPKPARYAGDKTEVPTNKPKTMPWEGTAGRWAGGWDIDRVFIDFADADYLAAFWAAAVLQYQTDSDADVAASVIAAGEAWATANTVADLAAGTSAINMIKDAIKRGRAVPGGKVNRIFLADDLYDEFTDTPIDSLPLWLAKANVGIAVPDGGASIDELFINADPRLADGEVSAFDNRALEVREKSPIQVTAPDVAHAGVDLGFYSYGGTLVFDPRLVFLTRRAA